MTLPARVPCSCECSVPVRWQVPSTTCDTGLVQDELLAIQVELMPVIMPDQFLVTSSSSLATAMMCYDGSERRGGRLYGNRRM